MLFSDEEFSERFALAMHELDSDEFNAYEFVIQSGGLGKVRASGVGSCAAKQLYSLKGEVETDLMNARYNWSSWMGTAGQELSAAILRRMGYTVTTVHAAIVSEHMSGHIDGTITGLDLGDEVMLWDSKVRNLFGYRKLATAGLPFGDPEMYLQMQWYMGQLGLKRCMITVHPHDYSSMRNEITRYKVPVHDAIAHRIFIPFSARSFELAEQRGIAITAARDLDMMVAREFNPATPADAKFPCGFCPWMSRCLGDDFERSVNGVLEVPAIPAEWRQAA